jgi:hypothetical protein
LDKTSYVQSFVSLSRKNLWTKPLTKPKQYLEKEKEKEKEIILCKHNIFRSYVLAEHNPLNASLKGEERELGHWELG